MQKETQQLGSSIIPLSAVPAQSSMVAGLKATRGSSGARGVKTLPNGPEEQHSPHRGSSDLRVQNDRVYVLNIRGEPLMPTTQQKANKLLKQDKAKVVRREPFTIQLKYATGENKQDIVLGVDAGYLHIGYSAITTTAELIAGELELRSDIKRLLEKRRNYRRTRRSRLWHREARFDNRGGREKGWLTPSIEHKFQSHIKLIEQLKRILPITEIVVEVATFDPQKMQNPEISGVEYQQGTLQGYNARNYLLEKWRRKCAYCGKKDVPLEVEHIVPKSRGGSNRIDNLCLSCHECNETKGSKTAAEFGYPKIQKQAKESLKAATFMNVVRWKLVDHFRCLWAYGYVTKYWRIKEGLEKSHVNDAFVIAGGKQQNRAESNTIGKQVRRQNRSLYKANIQKGVKLKRNTVKEVKGFWRWDKVGYKKKECFIFGLRSSGYFNLKTIDGNKVSDSVNSKKLTFIERARGRIEEVRRAIPPRAEARSLLAHN